MEVEIVLPKVSDDAVSEMLRHVTKAIVDRDNDAWVGGFLGGTYGYGADWTSTVFDMRPFYWGDCDCGYDEREGAWTSAHAHSADCYQSELRQAKIDAGATPTDWGWVDWPHLAYDERRRIEDRIYNELCAKHGLKRQGCAIHCTCAYDPAWKAWVKVNGHRSDCSLELPNFRHHESGLEVRWYKYIGRDMEVSDAPVDLTPILRDCLTDIAAQGIAARSDETLQAAQPERQEPVPQGAPNLPNPETPHDQ